MVEAIKETGETTPKVENKGGFSPITTQDEFDRLAARIRRAEQSKFANYDEIKAKADELDALKETSKTELQKAEERAKKAESERDALKASQQLDAWKNEVSKTTGIKTNLLKGTTKEEIEQHAKEIKEAFEPPAAPIVKTEGTGDTVHAIYNESLAKLVFGDIKKE